MTVETLVEASQAGDTNAFNRIVADYQGVVCSVAYNVTGDVHLSEDIAQEAFVAAWQRIKELRDPRKLSAWLCAIARNMARNVVRRKQRDPLSNAATLDARQQTDAESPTTSMGEGERLALVWQTLADIPEEYREPLILYYREGNSIREVAAALDLTEDCVKQRLSRGRKMMREHVARLVEDTLAETRPNAAFTSSVMAVLPLMTTPLAVGGPLAGGGATAGKGVAAAQGASAKLVALASGAALGGLAGLVIGVTGGFFGMWKGIRNSATLRVRRAMLMCSALTYAFVWCFLGYEALCGVLFWRDQTLMYTLAGMGWAAYIPLLFCLIYFSNRWGRRIAEEDAGRRPAPVVPLESSGLSRKRVGLLTAATLPLAITGSAVVVFWLYCMPWTRPAWPFVFGVTVCIHCAFVVLMRKGIAIARDEAAFRANPPARTVNELLDGFNGAVTPTTKRRMFYNDMGAMAGFIFGPMCPAFGAAISADQYVRVCVMYALSMAALLFGLWMRRTPQGRRRGYLIVSLYMGVVCGLSTAFAGADWLIQSHAVGLIPLALYWCIGVALFFSLKRADSHDDTRE